MRADSIRADELRTKRETAAMFAASGSGRVFVAAIAAAFVVRLLVGDPGRGDLVVTVVTVLLVGPVEWMLHRWLLHAPEDSWSSRRLGTGAGHRRHHLDPPDIEWLMLAGVDSAIAIGFFGLVAIAWVVPLTSLLGLATVGPLLTAWGLVAVAFAHYEWVHLLIHTRYRCTTRYYRRLAANHRRHHYRNERRWLGVTTNSGDRIARTLPRDPSDVPLSPTARTLVAD